MFDKLSERNTINKLVSNIDIKQSCSFTWSIFCDTVIYNTTRGIKIRPLVNEFLCSSAVSFRLFSYKSDWIDYLCFYDLFL